MDGIRVVATLLLSGSIFVDISCENLIKEFASYIWDAKAAEHGEAKPVEEHDPCLTGDTLVDTVTGQIPIKDLVGKNGKVFCWDMRKNMKTFSNFYHVRLTQKNARIFEIRLLDGTSIKATAEHLILTQRGWVRVMDLKKDDKFMRIT